jgi:hypothetical protein
MMDLRILGLAGKDQTLRQTTQRFGPWLMWSLVVLLVTGVLMVIGEPVRELVTFSFWLKMFLVAVGTIVAAIFLRTAELFRWFRECVSGFPHDAYKLELLLL